MQDEVKRKISLIHSFAGIVFGVIVGYGINFPLTFVSALAIAFVASYPLFIATRKIFNLSEREYMLKDWLTTGYAYFVITWLVSWTFVYNLRA